MFEIIVWPDRTPMLFWPTDSLFWLNMTKHCRAETAWHHCDLEEVLERTIPRCRQRTLDFPLHCHRLFWRTMIYSSTLLHILSPSRKPFGKVICVLLTPATAYLTPHIQYTFTEPRLIRKHLPTDFSPS